MDQVSTDPCYHNATTSIAAKSPRPRHRGYQKSGVYALKRAVRTLGSRTIDRRTRIGRALASWAQDLARDLGGVDALSTQQRAIIEQAATTRLLLDSIDAWLVRQPSLVDKRKRALLPVVRERQSLADALVRYLTSLGLERRAHDVADLTSYLAARAPSEHRQSTPERRADCSTVVTSSVEPSQWKSATSRHDGSKSAKNTEERQGQRLASFGNGWRPSEAEVVAAQPDSATSRRDEVTP